MRQLNPPLFWHIAFLLTFLCFWWLQTIFFSIDFCSRFASLCFSNKSFFFSLSLSLSISTRFDSGKENRIKQRKFICASDYSLAEKERNWKENTERRGWGIFEMRFFVFMCNQICRMIWYKNRFSYLFWYGAHLMQGNITIKYFIFA